MSQSKLVEVDTLIAANPDDQDLQQLRDDILQLIAKEQESAVPSAAASIDAVLPSIASAPTDIPQDKEAVIIHDERLACPLRERPTNPPWSQQLGWSRLMKARGRSRGRRW